MIFLKILKIIGIILLILILLIVLLLHFSAVVTLHAGRDGIDIKMKYLGLTLYPRKKKKKTSEPSDNEKPKTDESGKDADDFSDDLLTEVSDETLMQGLDEKQEQALLENAESTSTAAEERSDKSEKEDKKKQKSKKTDNKKNEAESENKDSSDGPENGEKKEKKSLKEKITDLRRKYEKIKPYIPVTWKYFKKLLKAVRIRIDDVFVAVGRDDAHEAAIFYGSVQAAICSLLTMFAGMFTLKVKRCDVDCRFAENVIDGRADISVRVRPSTVVAIVVCIGVRYLMIWLGNKRRAKSEKSSNDTNAAQTA